MKKTIILCLVLLVVGTTLKAQKAYTISGQLAADKQGFIILDYYKKGEYFRDSATVANGKFTFKGIFEDPLYAMLFLNPPSAGARPDKPVINDFIAFFIDGNMTVKSNGDLRSADIRGGKTQDDWLKRNKLFEPLNAKLKPLNAQMQKFYEEKNAEAAKPVQAEINNLIRQSRVLDSTYARQNPDSYVAFDSWRSKHTRGFAKPEWRAEFEHFSKAIKNSVEGKLMNERITAAETLVEGKPAPSFSLTDISGRKISLLDYKGKNVLLVFWYRPFVTFETFSLYMRRAEKRLKEKNTVIVGINFDNDETWRTVSSEEFPGWVHLTAATERTSRNDMGATARAYGIYSANHLPAAFLIGPEGKLLSARLYLNDNELGLKLEKLVK
jgi:peroxiredoxin